MHKFITLLLVFILLITGFSYSKNIKFQNNQDCYSYYPELQEKYTISDVHGGIKYNSTIDKVFYSEKLATCVYVWHSNSTYNGEIDTLSYELRNLFTDETFIFVSGCSDRSLYTCGENGHPLSEAQEIFTQKIKKYE